MGNNDKQLRVIVFCDQYENTLREAPTLLVTNQIVGVWVEGGPDGGGRYSIYPGVGRCGPAPRTLTLFKR